MVGKGRAWKGGEGKEGKRRGDVKGGMGRLGWDEKGRMERMRLEEE